MKRTLVLAAALLLACSLAWAEEPAPNNELFAGGGCMLPDLAGLSPEQISAAALEAGFRIEPINVQVPACPVTFHCNSITNCGAGPICALRDIGSCCTTGGGITLCCITGQSIQVQRCRCQCTGNPCAIQCPNSTDVTWGCV